MKMRAIALSALTAGLLLAFTTSAQASSVSITSAGITYGADAGYGIVSVGSNASLTINSGPILGSVLVGQGSSVSTSGGNNGGISGTINYDSTLTLANLQNPTGTNGFGGLQNPPSAGQYVAVSNTFTSQAITDAATLSSIASGLTADVTLASIGGGTTTFNASTQDLNHDGIVVVDVGQIQNANIVLQGNSSSVFVFNVSDDYNTNQSLTLSGGVLATNVLFNFTDTSGNVFQTSGGDVSVGTYLATDGGNFQFSNLALNPGNLINTDGHIQFVSGSGLTGGDTGGGGGNQVVPLPPAVWSGLGLMGAMGAGAFARRRRMVKRMKTYI